jgi:hypothetical protein
MALTVSARYCMTCFNFLYKKTEMNGLLPFD